eukprot:TRINITY_DN3875_c0_g1_i1.p1 TRINITY_DN3875_c0_g1~~TRINITY_DN3875_c0_g1_i1.p1  ORF type:complete len:858 (+),score=73.64 TRINITY_DN3875_c0_g1_i1:33-2606(+)
MVSSAWKCSILCLSLFATCACGDREVTIHTGASPQWWETAANTWPCLEFTKADPTVHLNMYGCFHAFDRPRSQLVRWLVPEHEGPIRPSARPDLCLDASRPIAFLKGNRTFSPTTKLESLLERTITLRPCSGSMAQQFLVKDNGCIYLASSSHWALRIEIATLTLDKYQLFAPSHFTLLSYRDPDTTSVFGSLAIENKITRILDTVVWFCVFAYAVVSLKKLCGIRWVYVVNLCSALWSSLTTRSNLKVRTLLADRRVRRTQFVCFYSSHLCTLWTLFRVHSLLDLFDVSKRRDVAGFNLTNSELLPLVALTLSCTIIRVRPIQSSISLDILTVLFSTVWSFQYYMMSQSMGGMNVSMYLYHESWMMLLRTCINLTIGRVAVAIPCTAAVTAVDVYCQQCLTPLHIQFTWLHHLYPFKQAIMCVMVCMIQYCLERLSVQEVEAVVDRCKAQLCEQLATRLTTSMYDAVVHLDCRFNFAKPAPKLASILLRGQLGVFQTDFLQLVVPEDRARLVDYLKSIALADESEIVLPIHISLLDAMGHRCRAQVFASAYRDDDGAAQYVLGVGEFMDVQRNPNEPCTESVLQHSTSNVSVSIPEDRVTESDSDAEKVGAACKRPQFSPQTFDLSICAKSGAILSSDATFQTFIRHFSEVRLFQSLFNDPAAVWSWLQMSLVRLRSEEVSSPTNCLSRAFAFGSRELHFDANVEMLGVESQEEEGTASILLKLHVLRRQKRRGRPSKAAKFQKLRSVGADMDITLRAARSDPLETLDIVQRSASTVFQAILDQGWFEWQEFWNECFFEFEAVPFARSKGNFKFEVSMDPSDIYVASAYLTVRDETASSQTLLQTLPRPGAMLLSL